MNIIEETEYLCPHCAGDVVKFFRNEEDKCCMDGEYRCMSCDNVINASTQSTIWPYKQKVKIESNENYLPKNYIENRGCCSNFGFKPNHIIT